MSTNAELIARAKRAADAFYMPFTQRDLILELIAALEAAYQERKDAVRRERKLVEVLRTIESGNVCEPGATAVNKVVVMSCLAQSALASYDQADPAADGQASGKRAWTVAEAKRLHEFQEAMAYKNYDEAYNAIYWLVSDHAADPYYPWAEVEALAPNETKPQESAPFPGDCGEPAGLLARIAAQQARIDALMLEYCPDDMTPEQVAEWQRNQKVAESSTPAGQIEGTQEQPCRARSGPPTESSGRPAAPAGSQTVATQAGQGTTPPPSQEGDPAGPANAAATPETDMLERPHPPKYPDRGLVGSLLLEYRDLCRILERQRDEALKIVGLARKCVDLDGRTVRCMKDSDPYKGPLNDLADALDAYDAAIAREKGGK